MNYMHLWHLLRKTFSAWSGHEASRLGAALAFYSILSLAPLMVLVVAIAGLVFGHSSAQDQIIAEVEGMVGQQGGDAVRAMIEQGQKPAAGLIASLVGVVTLLFGASGVFGELQTALNRMWDVKTNASAGIWATVRRKLFSFGMVLSVGFLLLVSLIISAGLAALGKYLGGLLPLPELVLHAVNFAVSLSGITVLFALIFKYVPDACVLRRDVWIGALATAFFFSVGKFLIGLYIGKAAVGSAYGAAGSLVVVIVWVYYSSLIFLFGAEFTHVLANESAEKSPSTRSDMAVKRWE
jgi:membrane protein